jgi:Domain of unknown function (DUF4476)
MFYYFRFVTKVHIFSTMKFVSGLLFCFACSLGAVAQQHFVYIQTEGRQTFYAQVDSTIFSSSASGYLILGQLPDSSYKIIIGFPKNEWPAQQYSFVIKNNDPGFLLKYTGDKWVLADLESTNIIKPDMDDHSADVVDERTDPFATMLSNAVDDPSLKQKLVPIEVKLTAADSIHAAAEAALPLRSVITKISSRRILGGTEMTYTDVLGDEADTIKIFLPTVKKIKQPNNNPLIVQATVPDDNTATQPLVKSTKNKSQDQHFLNMSVTPETNVAPAPVVKLVTTTNNKVADTATATPAVVVTNTIVAPAAVIKKDTAIAATAPHPMVNSECKNLASQEDFIKLRRKMVDQKNDNDMLAVAKKEFRTRCFTTEQIKNLGAIFFGDQGKYNFFETAYEIVADGQNYEILKSQLSDPYYVARFEALLHH